jgi:hypothetical protein
MSSLRQWQPRASLRQRKTRRLLVVGCRVRGGSGAADIQDGRYAYAAAMRTGLVADDGQRQRRTTIRKRGPKPTAD